MGIMLCADGNEKPHTKTPSCHGPFVCETNATPASCDTGRCHWTLGNQFPGRHVGGELWLGHELPRRPILPHTFSYGDLAVETFSVTTSERALLPTCDLGGDNDGGWRGTGPHKRWCREPAVRGEFCEHYHARPSWGNCSHSIGLPLEPIHGLIAFILIYTTIRNRFCS